jgi:hypothetical protein
MDDAINFFDLDGDGGGGSDERHRDKRAALTPQQQQPARTLNELADLYETYAPSPTPDRLELALAMPPLPPAYAQLDALLTGEFLTAGTTHEEIAELLADPFILLGDSRKALTILQLSKFVSACVALGHQQYADAEEFIERVYALDDTGLAAYLDCATVKEHARDDALAYTLVTLQLHHHLYALYLLWTDPKKSKEHRRLCFTGFLLFQSAESYEVDARLPRQLSSSASSILHH